MIEMTVAGIALDARTGHPIVVLNDSSKRRALPIWIGLPEANAITRALENYKPERPMTHDLLLNVVQQLGYKVKHIEINELSSNTYFATIVLMINDPAAKADAPTKAIDARPSDAIALALRAKAPIFVAPQVVAEGTIPADLEKDEEEAEEFKKFIDQLKASDFKKFKGEGTNPPDFGPGPGPGRATGE
jgi:bifunctional DNase/RNase